MKIESFLVSDAATDQNGKLNILGAFDTIFSKEENSIHPHCSISIRLRLMKEESSKHSLYLSIKSPNGKKLVNMNGDFETAIREGTDSGIINLVLNVRDLKIEGFGKYSISLSIDNNEIDETCFYVKQMG